MTTKNIGVIVASTIAAAAVVFTTLKVFVLKRQSGKQPQDSEKDIDIITKDTPLTDENSLIVKS